jgi:large subunit ribosomal protein L24
MNRPKLHVKKDDFVKVIAGAFKGVEGKVLKVITKSQRVHVEGVGKLKKAVKPSQKNPEGGIIDIDRPIHISNVAKVGVEKKAEKPAKKAAKKAARKKAQ